MVVNRTAIVEVARQLGINGKPVCIHVSLRSFPKLENEAETLIEGLLDAGVTVKVATMANHAFSIQAPPDDRPLRNGVDYAQRDRRCRRTAMAGDERHLRSHKSGGRHLARRDVSPRRRPTASDAAGPSTASRPVSTLLELRYRRRTWICPRSAGRRRCVRSALELNCRSDDAQAPSGCRSVAAVGGRQP